MEQHEQIDDQHDETTDPDRVYALIADLTKRVTLLEGRRPRRRTTAKKADDEKK